MVRFGVAAGSAATINQGTRLCSQANTQKSTIISAVADLPCPSALAEGATILAGWSMLERLWITMGCRDEQ
ncbi:hypothetical protein LNP17_18605 [Klebsiella variicola subsp. variicola]|nr:hypothetical protein [Klebsiella variicola subsp. variicola]